MPMSANPLRNFWSKYSPLGSVEKSIGLRRRSSSSVAEWSISTSSSRSHRANCKRKELCSGNPEHMSESGKLGLRIANAVLLLRVGDLGFTFSAEDFPA